MEYVIGGLFFIFFMVYLVSPAIDSANREQARVARIITTREEK